MSMYVIAQKQGDGYLLLSINTSGGGAVLAFESPQDAEDYADDIDEPGEFVAIPYEDSMGPCVVAI